MATTLVCTHCKKRKSMSDFPSGKNRNGKGSWCTHCCSTYKAAWAERNRAKVLESKTTWAKKDREENKGKWKNKDLIRYYGITLDEYNELYKRQNGCCAICGISNLELQQILSIDHDHKSKVVRGLLCPSCNSGLGFFRDSVDNLNAAIKYLGGEPSWLPA